MHARGRQFVSGKFRIVSGRRRSTFFGCSLRRTNPRANDARRPCRICPNLSPEGGTDISPAASSSSSAALGHTMMTPVLPCKGCGDQETESRREFPIKIVGITFPCPFRARRSQLDSDPGRRSMTKLPLGWYVYPLRGKDVGIFPYLVRRTMPWTLQNAGTESRRDRLTPGRRGTGRTQTQTMTRRI